MIANESFSWFRSDVKATTSVGNKVRIKGKAIFPTISGNNRQYVADELLRAARTLANVPIDVNHEYDLWTNVRDTNEALGRPFTEPPPKYKGNVLDADYEDGYVEYVAEVNHPEYAQKLRDRQSIIEGAMTREAYVKKWGKEPIYGVSISASYRAAERNGDINTPRGIIFRRLSLVEDPEKPGVQGTTLSVFETLNEQSFEEASTVSLLLRDYAPSLVETYQQEVMLKMTSVKEIPVDNGQMMGALKSAPRKATETAKAEEPKAKESGDCAAMMKAKHPEMTPEQVKAECDKAMAPKAEEPKKEEPKAKEAAEQTPLERVAEAEKALEGEKVEKLRDAKLDAALEAITCAGGKIKSLTERQDAADAKVDEAKKTITEDIAKRLEDSLTPIKANLDTKAPKEEVKKVSEALATVPEGFNQIAELFRMSTNRLVETETKLSEEKAKLASAEEHIKHLQETVKSIADMQVQLTGISAKASALEAELKKLDEFGPIRKTIEEMGKKLAESEGVDKKLREDLENLLTHVKGGFKAPEKLTETKAVKKGADTYPEDDKKLRGA